MQHDVNREFTDLRAHHCSRKELFPFILPGEQAEDTQKKVTQKPKPMQESRKTKQLGEERTGERAGSSLFSRARLLDWLSHNT